jgi:ABC-type amino acid transport substrate-binding protein
MTRARGSLTVGGWALALVASTLVGQARADDFEALRRRGRLRAIVERSDLQVTPVFSSQANAFEREILAGFAALHGLTVELVVVDSFEQRLEALLAGRGDLVAGLVITPERLKRVAFTQEVFPVRHVAVTLAPQRPVTSLDELRALRLGTVPGSSWAEEIAAVGVPSARVDAGYATPAALVSALVEGKVDAIVLSTRYAILARLRRSDLQLGLMLGRPSSVAFAVRREQTELRAALDRHIAALRRSADWSRLVVRTFGDAGLEVLRRAREE